MATAFVFPGQGSQAVGMGRALSQAFPAARRVFEEVDDALGEKLSAIIWEGPLDRLTLTENAQPALMAASLAAMRVRYLAVKSLRLRLTISRARPSVLFSSGWSASHRSTAVRILAALPCQKRSSRWRVPGR